MQFDYAEVTAETTGKLQYAQFSQETYDTEVRRTDKNNAGTVSRVMLTRK